MLGEAIFLLGVKLFQKVLRKLHIFAFICVKNKLLVIY